MRRIGKFEFKGPDLVKGRRMEGVRKVGSAESFVRSIVERDESLTELYLIDVRASLYGLTLDLDTVTKVVEGVFCPVTVGGGIRSVEDAKTYFDIGCERVSLNSVLATNFELVKEISNLYGTQAVCVQLELKMHHGEPKCFYEWGREIHESSFSSFVERALDYGCGEFHCISIDADGMLDGPNPEILRAISSIPDVPVVYSGGIRNLKDVQEILEIVPDLSGYALASTIYAKDL